MRWMVLAAVMVLAAGQAEAQTPYHVPTIEIRCAETKRDDGARTWDGRRVAYFFDRCVLRVDSSAWSPAFVRSIWAAIGWW